MIGFHTQIQSFSRLTLLLSLMCVGVALGACENMFRLPKLPNKIKPVKAGISKIEVAQVTKDGTSFNIHVWLENPNDFQLPLEQAVYDMKLQSQAYHGDIIPNATLPANGRVNVTLRAAFAIPVKSGMPFQFDGIIKLKPPGEIQKIINNVGVPLPEVKLSASGNIQYTPKSNNTNR